jgi:Tfp pilus assembly protein PilV
MRLERKYREAGAGLVEAVVSALVLSVVSLGLVEVLGVGDLWSLQGRNRQTATLLADEALERVSSLPYAQIGDTTYTRRVGALSYCLDVIVREDLPDADVKSIEASVRWQTASSPQGCVTLGTLRSRR